METINAVYTPNVLLTYNTHDVTEDFTPYLIDITYTDFEQDQSDELSVTLKDPDGLFRAGWCPEKGSKLGCILYSASDFLNCGTFTIDEVEYSADSSGCICTMRALAASHNKSVRTRNTIGYKSKTLVQIAKEIGARQGFTVAGSAGNILIDKITQACETDLAFLRRLAGMYGYVFKITDDVLTFTHIEELENAETALTFDRSQLRSWNFTNTAQKQYGKCSASYYDPKTKKLKTVTVKNESSLSSDTLKLSAKYNSLDAAKRAASIGLKNGSTEITGAVVLKDANSKFIAGVNIELVNKSASDTDDAQDSTQTSEAGVTDFGIYAGVYHVTRSEHRMSCGVYEVSGDLKKC